VSVKLVIATYKSSVGTETLLARIDQLGSAIARLEAAAAGSSPARRRVEE
jgi:hypothetical protein